MNSNSLKDLAIKSPKRYKIALAIANGLNEGKQLKEIFTALGINHNTGYSVAKQLKEEIAEMRHIQEEPEGNPTLIAKKILQDGSPEMAELLLEIARTETNSARERRQAAKDALQLAEIGEQKSPIKGNLESFKVVMTKIYQNWNINQEKGEAIDAEILEGPQTGEAESKGKD
ncbi:MAG: hypothetical protein ACFFCW_38810 [Candidatus Hodarchaeota archaeon]